MRQLAHAAAEHAFYKVNKQKTYQNPKKTAEKYKLL
jgi:hypothetical protein